MGMAASQARLLCITARIHDVEYQAQAIQSAKIQLATQEDQAYQEYNAALDATTLTINSIDVKSGEKATVPATFNNLCSRSRLRAANGDQYAIRNNQGLLIVEDSIEEGYHDFLSTGLNDPYQFAFFMLKNGNSQTIGNIENGDFTNALLEAEEEAYASVQNDTLKSLHTKLEELTTGGVNIYDASVVAEENREEYEDTLSTYRKILYTSHSAEVDKKVDPFNSTEETDTSLFNYYVDIYKQIQACGGCVSIEDYDGMHGDAANDSEWLQNMIKSGQFTIETIKEDKTGKVTLNATSPSSNSSLTYTNTSSIDNRALAKAEAEYEHKLKEIDKKDQKFDLDLSKLETERTALTTEYESVKKVIEDNIDRTFGIFS